MSGDPARWNRVKALFQSALDLPLEERPRFLSDDQGGREGDATGGGSRIQVVLNWTEELKRLVPTR